MKKITVLILSALLLFGCTENNEASNDASVSMQDYQSKAHDALENSSDTIDESFVSDISVESSYSVSDSSSETDTEESISESEPDISLPDISESHDEPVDAVIPEILLVTADIAYEDGTAATLVCGRDGSIDLYFANGYEMRNMGEKEDCREMSDRLLKACKEHFYSFEKVTELPFPESGTTFIYIKTTGGIYKLGYDNTEILLGAEGDIEICVKNAVTNITKYAPE